MSNVILKVSLFAGLGAGTADGVVSGNGGLVVVVCHGGRQPCVWVWCCASIPRDLFCVLLEKKVVFGL